MRWLDTADAVHSCFSSEWVFRGALIEIYEENCENMSFKGSYGIEYGIEFHGNMLINMAFAEEPLFVFYGFDDIFKECMNLNALKNVNAEAVFERCRRFMCNDVIHLEIMFFQTAYTVNNFGMSRLFTLPPVTVMPEFEVLTVTAAEGEDLFAFNSVDLPTH